MFCNTPPWPRAPFQEHVQFLRRPESLLHDVVEASKKKETTIEQGVTACPIFKFFLSRF